MQCSCIAADREIGLMAEPVIEDPIIILQDYQQLEIGDEVQVGALELDILANTHINEG